MTKNAKEVRDQVKKSTDDYYLHLLNEFREMLNDCFAIEDEEDTISLVDDGEWSSLKIKSYNNFIQSFWGLVNTTRGQDQKHLKFMEDLFFNEHRISDNHKIIDKINVIQPLHNATLSFSKINKTFEKIKAVASLRLIISKKNTHDDSDITILSAYGEQLQNCNSVINKHRNPDWDKFYNWVSILPFIGLPRAAYSFWKRGTIDFTLTDGEVIANNINQLINSVKRSEESNLTNTARF